MSDLERTLQAIHLHASESAHSREKNPRHKPTCDLSAQIFVLGCPKSAQEKGRQLRICGIESPHITDGPSCSIPHQKCTFSLLDLLDLGSHCWPSFESSKPSRYLRLQPASKFGPNGIFHVQKNGWMRSSVEDKGTM